MSRTPANNGDSSVRVGFLARLARQVRSDIREVSPSPDRRWEESAGFQTYAVAKSMLVSRLMAVGGAINLVFWAPTDFFVYGNSGLIGSILVFRAALLAVLLAIFFYFSTVKPTPSGAWQMVAAYWLVIAAIFGILGYVSGPEVPLLYTSFIVPTATAAYLVPLNVRIVMNFGGAAVCLLAYFGPHPEYRSYPFGDMLLVDLLFSCATGVLLGHFIYRLERTSFARHLAIQQHAAELEDLDRAKDSFVATISHELRTPLNSIIGLTDVVLDEKLSPEVKGYVRTIRRSGEVLQRLVNDVLDLAKIRAGKLEMETGPLLIQDVVENCVSLFLVAAEEKGLTLAYHVPWAIPELVGDDGRIGQILINLIGNAVKFTAAGEILVVVDWAPGSGGEGGRLTIQVTDTGPGIPPEKREAVFEEFAQVDASTSRRFGGSGLGLPIVRRLAQLMGGDVAIQDNKPHGSIFTVTLPVEAAAEKRATVPPIPPAIVAGGQVVVVCAAHALIRRRMKDSVANLRLPVEEAPSEEAAVELAQRLRRQGREVGAVVLDLRASAGHFARSPLLQLAARTSIIVITSNRAATDDVATLRMLGARAVLFRPARRIELRDTLAAVLSGEPVPLAAAPSFPSSSPVPSNASTRILVIDDVADNRRLLEAFVKDSLIVLDTAASGEEGLALFQENLYDAVFLDIQMPGMDGYAVIDRMHAWEKEHGRKPTPIIALTAHVTSEHQQRIRQHGFTHQLAKPIRKRDFLEAVAGYETVIEQTQPQPIVAHPTSDIAHLLPAYFHNRRKDLVALRGHLGEGNFHEIGRIGHRLQGSGGSYGFHDISAIGTRMEEAATRADVNEIRATIAELESSITRHYGNA